MFNDDLTINKHKPEQWKTLQKAPGYYE